MATDSNDNLPPFLVMEALTLVRGQHCLLRNFSLRLHRGECVLLAGANGSGKSSLLDAACGVLPAEQGSIFWLGQALAQADHTQWHYLAHADALKRELSVRENLRFQAALALAKVPEAQLQQALADMQLSGHADTPVGKLSQGQQRRTALLHLRLLPQRPVWLLDEPFNTLDHHARHTLSQWMNQHCASGGAIVFTNHFELPPSLQLRRTVHLDGAAA